MTRQGQHITVVGDMMLDVYVHGQVHRLSPEAPCPILDHPHREYMPGGAANVAAQLHAMGHEVTLAGNSTDFGPLLPSMQEDRRYHLETFVDLHTAQSKYRYIADGRQLLRVDHEQRLQGIELEQERILGLLRQTPTDVAILSDYNKGFLTRHFTQALIQHYTASGTPIVVDIKEPDTAKYHGATIIKGNQKECSAFFANETQQMTPDEARLYTQTHLHLVAQTLQCQAFIMTCSGDDAIVCLRETDHYTTIHIPVPQVTVHDVTGAGDMVTAMLADGIGLNIRDNIQRALRVASLMVSMPGRQYLTPSQIDGTPTAANTIASIPRSGRTVFTNGCFDILHAGHLHMLRQARSMGDRLVVGLNTDDSVRRLKGDGRPVNTLQDRMDMLLALDAVDYVIPFEQDTPLELIRQLRPDILVKGGDYTPDTVVGSHEVQAYGGRVAIVPLRQGLSTTAILNHKLNTTLC